MAATARCGSRRALIAAGSRAGARRRRRSVRGSGHNKRSKLNGDAHIQEKMVWHFVQCDQEYGARVAQGLGITIPELLPVAAGR
jgi:hypothetical protein